ncbi:IclR family transcriptional regulator [Actinophytocola sp.]|uniref:IclR family transcriptional regulator n=1 Tax=Actinophytocola sp. TaxID=1872138 RepID=UPI002ECFC32B
MVGESVVSRVVRIVEAFAAGERALGVSEIARRSGLHVATVSRQVEQLVGSGWLERTEDRRVRIGVRLWEVASRASPTVGLREAAMPFMEDLHAVVGQHVQLGVREGTEVLFVERLSAPGAVINLTPIAGRLPLHASSGGLVLLAFAPPDVQEEVLSGRLRRFTDQTITDRGRLRKVLAEVRRNGSVVCRGHIHVDAAGVAVPVRDGAGVVDAALAVVVPNNREAHRVVPALQTAAHGITRMRETLSR